MFGGRLVKWIYFCCLYLQKRLIQLYLLRIKLTHVYQTLCSYLSHHVGFGVMADFVGESDVLVDLSTQSADQTDILLRQLLLSAPIHLYLYMTITCPIHYCWLFSLMIYLLLCLIH